MHTALRPYATAGIALVGAGLIAISPATTTPHATVVRDADVALTASLANVPANAFIAALNTPANLVFGIQRFADSMAASGSWEVSHPDNVWGWDPANPEMLEGFVDMLVPFPALSRPLGEHMNWWAAANLPMYAGCAFECSDPIGMLKSMFTVPMWKFYSDDGYTFGEVINPVDGKPTEWSEKTIRLDRFEVIKSVANYFTGEPEVFRPVTMYDFVTAGANLAAALQITGHVPDWLAVREIETFVKLFLPKPEHPAVEDRDYHWEPPAMPTAPEAETNRLVSLDTLRPAKVDTSTSAEASAPKTTETSSEVADTAQKTIPVTKATETTAATETTDATETTQGPETTEPTGTTDPADEPNQGSAAAGNRKGGFSVKATVDLLEKKFAAAKEQAADKAVERKTARAGKAAERTQSGASSSAAADTGDSAGDD
ncbi:hypothetical protein EV589_3849 [Mycobacterium sp. BK558]|nr:hypothetical protein EV589_3849 [Mycobacterium sp. BK558]